MAILEIKKYPDPVLKKKSAEVREITEDIKKLSRDMVETMTKKDGIGLAAPQVGELKRIIAVQTKNGPAVFINPKIIKKSEKKEVMEEGCLSLPGIWLKVKRPRRIKMEALDVNGKIISIDTEGLSARVLQHEIDHLDGVLILDKIGFFERIKIRKRFKNSSFSI